MSTFEATILAAARQLRAEYADHSICFLQRHLKLGYRTALALDAELRAGAESSGVKMSSAVGSGAFPSRSTALQELPVHTRIYEENAAGGLLLCGINPGYTKADELLDAQGVDRLDKYKSFFSDTRVNDYKLRNTMVKWFGLWGFSLAGDEARAGALERSIVQTNWLPFASNNVNDVAVRRQCVDNSDTFLTTCEQLRPGLVIFFSKDLLYALASSDLRQRVEAIFGQVIGIDWIEKPVSGAVPFKIGRLRFARATVLSVPHPSGAWVPDAFVEAQDAVKAEIGAWWDAHRRRLANRKT